MRILRGIFAVLVLLGAACLGGIAYLEAGGFHGWTGFATRRLLGPHALGWTLGCVAFSALGIIVARTGEGAPPALFGRFAGCAAVSLGVVGIAVSLHHLENLVPWAVASVGLAVIAAIALARK
jgi:hypothetical protein